MIVELLLCLAPVAALVLALVAGRYPGAERLERLAAARGRVSRRRPVAAVSVPHAWPELRIAHGGLLLARRLSGRAPPAAA